MGWKIAGLTFKLAVFAILCGFGVIIQETLLFYGAGFKLAVYFLSRSSSASK